ncbi:MAG TPA: methyl-accepting chemotaxis protein, partial [Methylobacterium sp.]
ATQEIVRNVTQAAQGTQTVTASIGAVKDAAGETGAASSQVLVSASALSRQSAHLSEEVSSFLAKVRAA